MLNKQDEKLYDKLILAYMSECNSKHPAGRLATEAHSYAMKAIALKNAEKAGPAKKAGPSLE